MRLFSFRRMVASAVSIFTLLLSPALFSQVLETPQIYQLPPFNPSELSQNGLPVTLDSGVMAGVTSDIGDVPLNDVVIIGNPEFGLSAGFSSGSGRIWSLVHTSGTDTQALEVASPVDIAMTSSDPDQCYELPTSSHLLDLTGDDVNDLALLSPCFSVSGGFNVSDNVLGIQGNSSDPFQADDLPTFLGSQLGGTLNPAFNGGQLAMVSADFDGDGATDLGYYNVDTTDSSNSLQTLLNNGTLGLLPSELSPIDGPLAPPDRDESRGFVITAGDFDGNGTSDMAVAFNNTTSAEINELLLYSGNGDGTFDQAAFVEGNIAVGSDSFSPRGLASGDFNGDDFADFAISWRDLTNNEAFIAIALCTSAGCDVTNLALGDFLPTIIVVADFDGDGLDDFANILNSAPIVTGGSDLSSSIQIRLNDDGVFNVTPDQTLSLDLTGFTNSITPQLVAQDIDACGGPDLAFTGAVYNFLATSASISQGITSDFQYQAAVAFNPNETPTADAGTATQVSSGFQVGGSPTCSDLTDDAMEVSWAVISGSATLSSSTASNPIVTGASGTEVVLQVTCTDPCGLSATDTVTVPTGGFVQGSCGTSLTGTMSASLHLAWLMIPAALGGLGLLRRRRSV